MTTETENGRHTEETLRPVEAAEHKAGNMLAEQALEERLGFEQLLSDVSARFVNMVTDRVDSEIEQSLKQILRYVDRRAQAGRHDSHRL